MHHADGNGYNLSLISLNQLSERLFVAALASPDEVSVTTFHDDTL